MTKVDLWKLSASQVVQLTKSGDISVEAYANSLFERIEARDLEVKAWAYLDKELVLASARALDKVPAEQRGPLHGIAIGVKDVMYTKDMPTQHNSGLYKDSFVPVDAGPVATLRAAGALIFGKTTTTEFAATTVGGPSCNPHDVTRTPGGSSSGSAAAVGDYQVPIALGTQTVGSTIRPGSYNGICAMKPSWGAISVEGLKHYSLSCDSGSCLWSLACDSWSDGWTHIKLSVCCSTVFARSVDDMELLANVFGLKDDVPIPQVPYSLVGARIAAAKTHVWPKALPGLVNAWNKALLLLRAAGVVVEEVDLPPEISQAEYFHKVVLHMEGRASFLGDYSTNKTMLDNSIQEQTENRLGWTRKQLVTAYDGLAALRSTFDALASKYDAVLVPSVPDEAPVGIHATGNPEFCAPWTILHTPVVQLPGFQGQNGMPIGLSLTGPRYHDEHVLHVARAMAPLFAERGGWKHQLF